jgi:hypothetical protein
MLKLIQRGCEMIFLFYPNPFILFLWIVHSQSFNMLYPHHIHFLQTRFIHFMI